MEISYINLYNQIVSLEQVNNLDEYAKIYAEHGVIKMKENFDSGELYHIQYYKGVDETDQQIIEKFKNGQVDYSIIIKTYIGNFTLENVRGYLSDDLKSEFNFVYDNLGKKICSETIDLTTNLPIYKEAEKHYYDPSYDDFFPIMSACYNEDGSLDYAEYKSFNLGAGDPESFFLNDADGYDFDLLCSILNFTPAQTNYYRTANLSPDILI